MKVKTPEIVWHNKQPVFTVDFHRSGPNWRMVTGGADNDVKVWKVECSNAGMNIHHLASLCRHTKAVNVVRFSLCGSYLASAGDDHVVVLWVLEAETPAVEGNLVVDQGNKESWLVSKMLRGHLEDIYDLCWSHDSSYIITGSVDNSAIIWDVQKGHQMHVLKDSKQYVQGVCWDPLGKVVALLSNDRTLRVYGIENKFRCLHCVSKLSTQSQDGEAKSSRMWIDESLNSFFRRLSFTPDGSFLIAPAGRYEVADKSKNATFLFSRSSYTRPVLQLPGPEKPTVVVKCCPVPFERREEPDPSLTCLPYRMVYAVASLDSVLLYDTQHSAPFGYVSNIHYSGITDLAWSNDGSLLVVSSSDCYCSFITFEASELGTPMDPKVMMVPSRSSSRDSTPGRSTPGRMTPRPQQQLLASKSHSSPAERAVLSGKGKYPAVEVISGGDDVDRKEVGLVTPTSKSKVSPMEIGSPNGTIADSSKEKNDSEKLTVGSRANHAPPRRVDFITLSSYRKVKTAPPQPSAASSDDGNLQTIISKKEVEDVTTASSPQPVVDAESSSNKSQLRRVNFITLSSQDPPQDPSLPSTAML